MRFTDSEKNGLWGEVFAARYLRDAGYVIVDANFRTRMGEIDIIAFKNETLVFCEVKTRSPHGKGTPAEAVDKAKQRRIALSALQYVKQTKYQGNYQFDVIEIYLTSNGDHTVHHIEQAFDGESAALR